VGAKSQFLLTSLVLKFVVILFTVLLSFFFCSGECAMIMNVLWQRLGNTGANWRHVYKVSFLERSDNMELIVVENSV